MNTIITGASTGIGYRITRSFARAGKHRIGIIARNGDALERLRKDYSGGGTAIIPYVFDLEDLTTQSGGLYRRISADFDRVDILINNAGYLVNKPFPELEADDYLKSYRVNFLAPALLIRDLLPLFSGSSHKHIVNISSMGGFQGSEKFTGLAAYSAAKAALSNLTESLAVELQEHDIHINCLALGAVQTEMLARAFPEYRAPVTAEDMGEFICRFAMDAGKVMNGKIIPVSLSTP